MDISGTCDERFSAVRDAFAGNFEPGGDPADVGAAVAVSVEGELVVDLWGGAIMGDDDVEQSWQPDTIINVFSTTKTVSALACLMLADAGELDLYAPVFKVWPEFRANNKASVEVRHVMSHTAGLPSWSDPVTVDVLYDWERATSLLAAQEPGTASGYHVLTQGYLEGEIVRRITGQTIGEFVSAEIAGPLGADFHIGTPAEHDARVDHVIPRAFRSVPPTPKRARSSIGSSARCRSTHPRRTRSRGAAPRSLLPAGSATPARSH